MIRRARGWRSIATLGIAGLALAACGGDDAADDGATTADASGASETSSETGSSSGAAAGSGAGVEAVRRL